MNMLSCLSLTYLIIKPKLKLYFSSLASKETKTSLRQADPSYPKGIALNLPLLWSMLNVRWPIFLVGWPIFVRVVNQRCLICT
jgi:hypothetical protein